MSTPTSLHVLAKLQKIMGRGAMKPLEEDDMDNYTSGGLGTVFSFVPI